MQAIIIDEHGGPEVLSLVEWADSPPSPGHVTVHVAAAGVNFIDTYHRSGLYDVDLPFGLGQEGAGTVTEVGEGVTELAVGDRVAWTGVSGSYATRLHAPADALVVVPDGIDLETAAAVMLQGLTAHYLVTDTFRLGPGHRCLVHAAAGGVGRLLVQMATRAGAEVFATVGSDAKADIARRAGAHHVIEYRTQPFDVAVRELAGDRPLDVVYDGVGRTTFHAGLGLLRPRGTMVTFGNASGPVEPLAPLVLAQHGSLFLTRPILAHYLADRAELTGRAADLFAWIAGGELTVEVGLRLPLTDAAEAHRRLEGRETVGKVLLVPRPST